MNRNHANMKEEVVMACQQEISTCMFVSAKALNSIACGALIVLETLLSD